MSGTQVLPASLSDSEPNDGEDIDTVGVLVVDSKNYDVRRGCNKIGRDSELCSIALEDNTVSKVHCVIESDGIDDTFIYDAGSTNRTKMGKTFLKPHCRYKLEYGSEVVLGRIVAKYIPPVIRINRNCQKYIVKPQTCHKWGANTSNIENIYDLETQLETQGLPVQNSNNTPGNTSCNLRTSSNNATVNSATVVCVPSMDASSGTFGSSSKEFHGQNSLNQSNGHDNNVTKNPLLVQQKQNLGLRKPSLILGSLNDPNIFNLETQCQLDSPQELEPTANNSMNNNNNNFEVCVSLTANGDTSRSQGCYSKQNSTSSDSNKNSSSSDCLLRVNPSDKNSTNLNPVTRQSSSGSSQMDLQAQREIELIRNDTSLSGCFSEEFSTDTSMQKSGSDDNAQKLNPETELQKNHDCDMKLRPQVTLNESVSNEQQQNVVRNDSPGECKPCDGSHSGDQENVEKKIEEFGGIKKEHGVVEVSENMQLRTNGNEESPPPPPPAIKLEVQDDDSDTASESYLEITLVEDQVTSQNPIDIPEPRSTQQNSKDVQAALQMSQMSCPKSLEFVPDSPSGRSDSLVGSQVPEAVQIVELSTKGEKMQRSQSSSSKRELYNPNVMVSGNSPDCIVEKSVRGAVRKNEDVNDECLNNSRIFESSEIATPIALTKDLSAFVPESSDDDDDDDSTLSDLEIIEDSPNLKGKPLGYTSRQSSFFNGMDNQGRTKCVGESISSPTRNMENGDDSNSSFRFEITGGSQVQGFEEPKLEKELSMNSPISDDMLGCTPELIEETPLKVTFPSLNVCKPRDSRLPDNNGLIVDMTDECENSQNSPGFDWLVDSVSNDSDSSLSVDIPSAKVLEETLTKIMEKGNRESGESHRRDEGVNGEPENVERKATVECEGIRSVDPGPNSPKCDKLGTAEKALPSGADVGMDVENLDSNNWMSAVHSSFDEFAKRAENRVLGLVKTNDVNRPESRPMERRPVSSEVPISPMKQTSRRPLKRRCTEGRKSGETPKKQKPSEIEFNARSSNQKSIPEGQVVPEDGLMVQNVSQPLKNRLRKPRTKADSYFQGKCVNVVFTGFESPSLEKIIRDLGGKKANDLFASQVLVTDQVRRTVKFLCAIGLCLPITSPQWLLACKKENKFVDPWNHILKCQESEEKWDFDLRETLEKAKKKKLLQGFSVFATESVKPPVEDILAIAECCGANSLRHRPDTWTKENIIVTCDEDRKWWPPPRFRFVKIVHYEFILSGVLQQTIDFKTYKLR